MVALAVTNISVTIGNRIYGDDGLCTEKACLLARGASLEGCLYIVPYVSIRRRLAYPNIPYTFENVL